MGDCDPTLRESLPKIIEMCEAKGVDGEIIKQIKEAIELGKTRDTYCEAMSTNPSNVVADIQKGTMAYPFAEAFKSGKTSWDINPRMMSGALECVFLQSLMSMSSTKHVLDIGTFTGSSALSCAEALPTDGTVVTCEFDPFIAGLAKGYFSKSPHGKKIKIRIGPAQETLMKLIDEKMKFDFVFIDANKDGYIEYFKGLVSKGKKGILGEEEIGRTGYKQINIECTHENSQDSQKEAF